MIKSRTGAIPYDNLKEKCRITNRELDKGMIVKSDSKFVYSYPRRTVKKTKHVKLKKHIDGKGSRTFKNFKCHSCESEFRITALNDIQWARCPICGGVNIDILEGKEERNFESKIK